MRDFPPEEMMLRNFLIARLVETFENYGFSPLETPIVERWEVLAAKYAGGEEILKEAFKLKDQGGRELGLRYELTVGLARFIAMNPTIKRPFKRYQIGPCFRDGPIKRGRSREFWQCDVDIVGTDSMLADAELVNLTLDFFSKIGFDVEIKVNNRKILKDLAMQFGVDKSIADSVILSLDKLERIGPEGVERELSEKGVKNAFLLLDTILRPSGKTNKEKINDISMRVRSAGIKELEEFFTYANDKERVQFTPSLARGLVYYTGTIFEVYLKNSAFASSLAAGGRYDNMIGDFVGTGEKFPAVGISFGLEPIMEVIKEQQPQTARKTPTYVFVIPIHTVNKSRKIAQQLRAAGINTDMDLVGRGISANLDYANSYNIPYVLIVGPDELRQDKVKLRDMQSGKEELLTLEQTIERLKA